MSARTVMIAGAAVFGSVGLALLFAPLEAAPFLALGAGPDNEATLQLLGATLFAFGLLDWQGRSAIYGGIYGRPITMGNALATIFLALGLGQEQWARPSTAGVHPLPGWGVSFLFLLLAVAFTGLLFHRPWIRTDAP